MKKILSVFAVLATLLLSGCVVAPVQPVYTQPYYQPVPVVAPVYVRPQPIYIQPSPIYIRPVPACYWTKTWDGYYRVYRNVRVCR